MSNSQLKTVKEFLRLQHELAGHFVLRTAAHCGLLAALDSGQKTAAELAQTLSLDPAAVELLLAVLVETGKVEHYGDVYALSPAARMLVDKRSLEDPSWSSLESYVRFGASGPGGHEADSRGTLLGRHAWMQTPAAMDAAEVLDAGRSRRGLRILELGGCQAIFSAALAHRDPDSLITVLNDPASLARAQETVASVGLEGQFELLEGDWLQPELEGEPFDLVLIAGGLHGTPPDTCQRLIERIASSVMTPTGELVVIDVFRGQPDGARTIAFFELELKLTCPDGQMHRPQSLRSWMQAAGLSQVRYAHLPSPPHVWGLILAQRT